MWLRYGPSSPTLDRMVHTDEAARLAAYLTSYIEGQGWSERDAAQHFGFTRSTLRRRLSTGDFKVYEVSLIANRLGTTSADLMQRAQGVAA